MPIAEDDLKALETTLGADHAELLGRIREAAAADATALDTLKAQAAAEAAAKAKAEKALAKAQADVEKARGGSDEQLKAALADAAKAQADLEAVRTEHRAFRIRSKLADKLGITDAAKRNDALTLLGLPEGVDLDDKGELVGAEAHIESFKKTRSWLFEPAAGYGGPPAGGNPPPGGKPKPKTRDEEIASWSERLFGKDDKGAKGATTH